MVRLYIVAGVDKRYILEDFEGNTQGQFDDLGELFRFVGINFNAYELIVDKSIVNQY